MRPDDILIIKFLRKYLFICKALFNGWKVKYIDNNTFEFVKEK